MRKVKPLGLVKEIKYMAILLQCAKCSEIFCQRMSLGEISKEMLPKFCPMKTSVNTLDL
jgi:hypothetical protein